MRRYRFLCALVICLGLILFCATGLSAAIYYVNSTADAGGDGTTQELTGVHCAFKTIAQVNAASFSGDDQILFNKGQTWRETLAPPGNGTSGHQITYGAYGVGADPIIYGSDKIVTWTDTNVSPETGDLFEEGFETNPGYDEAGWSETVGAGSTVNEDSTAVARPSDGGGQCLLIQKVSANFNAFTSNDLGSEAAITYIRGCLRYDAEGLGDTNEVRLLTAYDGNGIADANIVWSIRLRQIAGGTKKTFFYLYNAGGIANAKSNDISASTWYKYEVKYDHTNHLVELKLDGAVSLADTAITGTHKTGVRYIACGDATNGYTVTAYIDRVAVNSDGYLADTLTLPAGTWKAACALEPVQAWFVNTDTTISEGKKETVLANVNAEYDWYWTNGWLIVYAAATPDTEYTSVEAAVRTNCVQLGTYVVTRSYLTFDGLDLRYPSSMALAQWQDADAPSIIVQNCNILRGGINLEGADIIIQDNTMIGPNPQNDADKRGAMYIHMTTATDCIIRRNDISLYHSRGIWIGTGADSPVVTDNIVHDIDATVGTANEGYGIDFDGAGTPISGVVTCTGNTVYNCPTLLNGWGIYLENCSDGSDISDNLVYSCGDAGIMFLNYTTHRGDNIGAVVSYNIIYDCNKGVRTSSVSGVDIWNNVIDDASGADKIGVAVVGDTAYSSDIDIRNNVFGSGLTWCVRVPDNTWTNNLADFDYNCVENIVIIYEAGDTHELHLDDLQGASKALNSFTTAPAFTNQVGHDYTLTSGSPCRNAGVSLGLTTDFAGHAVGLIPDIGAYEYPVVVATLTTTAISSIASTTASSGGIISSGGDATVTARGVCWSESVNPTTADSKTTDGTGTGAFASSITGLTRVTAYHVRAYATNSAGTAYGSDLEFTTLAEVSTVTTTAVSSILSTTATSGGNVTDDGGATITARGVCWSTLANPTTADSKTADAGTTGPYASSITGLSSVTTYHVRSYATNSIGTSYGSDVEFDTIAETTEEDTLILSAIKNAIKKMIKNVIKR